jgi:hypothetical protein
MENRAFAALRVGGFVLVGLATSAGPSAGASETPFFAMPASGAVPLTVTFQTRISGFRLPTIAYVIDFGDGTSEKAADCIAPADACTAPGQNAHTYTKNGTYTVTLSKVTDPCAGRRACRARVKREIVGKLQVWAGTTPICTKEYRPVCGAKPVVCIKAPCDPVPTTYGNRCELNAVGAGFLHDGPCEATGPRKDRRKK